MRGVSHFCLSKHDVVYFCFKLCRLDGLIQISSWFETSKLASVTYWPLSKNRSKTRLRILRRIALDWVLYIFCIDNPHAICLSRSPLFKETLLCRCKKVVLSLPWISLIPSFHLWLRTQDLKLDAAVDYKVPILHILPYASHNHWGWDRVGWHLCFFVGHVGWVETDEMWCLKKKLPKRKNKQIYVQVACWISGVCWV